MWICFSSDLVGGFNVELPISSAREAAIFGASPYPPISEVFLVPTGCTFGLDSNLHEGYSFPTLTLELALDW